MIKLKLSTFERPLDQDIDIVQGELLSDAVTRVLLNVPLQKPVEEMFQVHINGYLIETDLWGSVKLNTSDVVIIHPKISGEDSNAILGQVLVIAAIAAATYFTGPLGLGAQIAIRVGVAVVAGYLAGQLFPPPVLKGQGAFDGSTLADSQMYSISSQQNATRKFGTVPRVYGTHRMYPVVAAAPYTDLEVDPVTGKKVQYFYAIYDFGFGPNQIEDLRIGNTLLTDYVDVTTRLVDLNKPAVSEGVWDDLTSDHFELYKGDVTTEQVGVEISGNRVNGDPQSAYQVIRNAANNPDNLPQEITVTLINPQGLYAINSSGTRGTRSIDYEVYFSKKNENVWKAYNDVSYVELYEAVGGDVDSADKVLAVQLDASITEGAFQQQLKVTPPKVLNMQFGQPLSVQTVHTMGHRAGNTQMLLRVPPPHGLLIGDVIKWAGYEIGVVTNITPNGLGQDNITCARTSQNIAVRSHNVIRTEWKQDYTPPGAVTPTKTQGQIDYVVIPDYEFSKKGVPLGVMTVTAQDSQPVYSSIRFTPREAGEYKVRITRVRSRSLYGTAIVDQALVADIKTRFDQEPIVTTKRHTFLEIRVKATGQLNGTIANLSGICSSVLDTWDGSQWVKKATNNPAWVFADLLTGELNPRKIDKSKLHLPSLTEWADYCDAIPTSGDIYTYEEPRFQCNFILDYDTTLQDLLLKVTSAAQASVNMLDGKYGVLLDINRTIPVQIFTPRNSTGFSSSKSFNSRPHGLKVTYIDPNSEWQPNEIIVYDDGYDFETATEFEDIQTFACTEVEQAWRFGRYYLTQNKLRQEVITLKVDFEQLVCTRGDYVKIVQDAMRVGGTAARVKDVTGNVITIDEGIETIVASYGYTFRSTTTGLIVTDTLTVLTADTFELDGDLPAVGDLIIIGEVGFITYECIVKSITPQDDMSATITLIEKADAIYDYETASEIPGYEPRLSATSGTDLAPPGEVQNLTLSENNYLITQSGYEYYMKIDWEAPLGTAYDIFQIYVDDGTGFDLVASTKNTTYRYIVDPERLGIPHTLKVLAVSANGNKLGLGEVTGVTGTPLRKTARPSSVTVFNSDITLETLQLFWANVPDLDIREYILRYTPDVSGLWETSTILMRVSSGTTLFATQARTGTYLIKAVDFNGNESLDAAAIITTIPKLFGLNVIAETNDFPPITGNLERVIDQGDAIILDQAVPGAPGFEEYYSDGYYYYEDFLDLGDIYSVRIRSEIVAEGYNASDIMSNWITLSDVDLLYSPGSAAWDVEAQYRATNNLNVMADWTDLSSIVTLSQGEEDIWTPWRKFIIGDVTARIVQFRLRLVSNVLNITPRVFQAKIKSDMPDRIESYNNLVAPDTGLEVVYDPGFKGPGLTPNVQISLENGQSGDYWEYTDKTLDGFTIVFYDKNDNPVSRQFDASIKGYGRKALNTI